MPKPNNDNGSLLHKYGLKATPKRIQLLELLAKENKPISAHELKDKWKSGKTDVVTLYRALEAFAAASIVRRIDLQHGHADYELVTPGDHHHHLVCTGCGTIEDFTGCPAKTIERNAIEASSLFASLQEHSLEFFGTCKACVA